jgi:hypothetical protein
MDSAFRDMLEGLKQTAEGLVLANEGIKKSVEAALRANAEHDDVRETVHRLETLVLDLVSKMTPPPDTTKTE